MKILLVDDEPLARMRLKSMLEHLQFEQIIEAKHGGEAVAMASKHLPDLIFMDIEMPEKDGMQAALEIKTQHPSIPVIFTTAHDEFAIKAFDLSATDYLLKPLSLERLQQALEKVGISRGRDKIRAKRGNDVILVSVEEVICLLAEDKYVTAYLHGQSLLLDQSLAELENSHPIFVRVHRNALINPKYLTAIHAVAGQSPKAVMAHTDVQPAISRRQLPAVKKMIKDL